MLQLSPETPDAKEDPTGFLREVLRVKTNGQSRSKKCLYGGSLIG
jgi:hypothetical protein